MDRVGNSEIHPESEIHPSNARAAEEAVEEVRRILKPSRYVVEEAERILGAKRFSEEQRKGLERQGYRIFLILTGKSVSNLIESGRDIGGGEYDPDTPSSMHSEVAINPDSLFLPDSNWKTLAKQEEMVEKFSQELGGEIPGVKAVIGQLPDYTELIFRYLDATGSHDLFGRGDTMKFIATKTPIDNSSDFAMVGHLGSQNDLPIFRVYDHRREDSYVFPLVVPV